MIYYQRFFRALAAACVLLATSGFSLAQQSALEDLESLLDDIDTLSAEVLQLIVESDGGVLEESLIQMHLKRPNGFYWETLHPFPELVVTDGSTLWNYQPDLEQVVLEDWDSSRSELAARLLSGETESLQEKYSIQTQPSENDTYIAFDLVPFAADSVYELITISFSESKLDTIRIVNKNGQRTVWEFQQVEQNEPLSDSQFGFDIPDGIEVIDNSTGD